MKEKIKKYLSKQTLSEEFKEFLYTDEIIRLLLNCGWLDGGCRSLMKALILWLGEENTKPFQIIQHRWESHSEHAFVKVGEYFIDGDGISTYSEMYTRWLIEENLRRVYIKPFNPSTEPCSATGEKPYYIDLNKISKLVKIMENRFDKTLFLSILKDNTSFCKVSEYNHMSHM